MSADIRFHGKLEYEERSSLEETLEQVQELLEEEDDDLKELLEEEWDSYLVATGKKLEVDISFSGPSEWWFAIESLVETLVADAVDGHIDGVLEGAPGRTRYFAGGEQDELDS